MRGPDGRPGRAAEDARSRLRHLVVDAGPPVPWWRLAGVRRPDRMIWLAGTAMGAVDTGA